MIYKCKCRAGAGTEERLRTVFLYVLKLLLNKGCHRIVFFS